MRFGRLVNPFPPTVLLLCLIVAAANAIAAQTDPEIEYLLVTVGNSGCLFVRNGSEHPPAEAESHLRMKYRKGARYIASADDFISRIASKSSWSGKPYQIVCHGNQSQPSGQWLHDQLSRYRAETRSGS